MMIRPTHREATIPAHSRPAGAAASAPETLTDLPLPLLLLRLRAH